MDWSRSEVLVATTPSSGDLTRATATATGSGTAAVKATATGLTRESSVRSSVLSRKDSVR